ncbi:MAG: AraC family transcriptional regulator [Gemmatimonadetes bacterium]|nr:AraC family transcriptional regulator [Gemmatimonadota bacterium]MYD12495.1 AraC family transcriptional regulator [Gemmatimonadota bacterium]MYI64582.1 AraC family transcriptional regulator [Gemmatimonadota bacterium]
MSPSRPDPGPDPDVDVNGLPTPPLLALLACPRLRERTRLALEFGTASRIIGPVAFADSWDTLGGLAAQHPGSPALVDTFHDNGSPDAPGPRAAWNGQLSRIPVIWYARPDPCRDRQLTETGITVAAHLLPGVDDELGAINTAILSSIDARCVRRLRDRIRRAAQPDAIEILGYALDLATGPCSVSDIARRSHRTERTLQRRCTIMGIPSPKRLLSLVRIFTVQRLAEWSGQPYGTVAVALGFSDRSNYRRLVRGVFGQTPTEIELCSGHFYVAKTIVDSVC